MVNKLRLGLFFIILGLFSAGIGALIERGAIVTGHVVENSPGDEFSITTFPPSPLILDIVFIVLALGLIAVIALFVVYLTCLERKRQGHSSRPLTSRLK